MSTPEQNPPPEPYEPHPNNVIRDRKRMRQQYGPYSYTKGMYVNGAQTPMKPRNIRIRSSIPIVFAAVVLGVAVWFFVTGGDPEGVLLMAGFAAFLLLLSWVGFRTARIREQWERENPESAKKIDY